MKREFGAPIGGGRGSLLPRRAKGEDDKLS